jgi:hypothetical protein
MAQPSSPVQENICTKAKKCRGETDEKETGFSGYSRLPIPSGPTVMPAFLIR